MRLQAILTHGHTAIAVCHGLSKPKDTTQSYQKNIFPTLSKQDPPPPPRHPWFYLLVIFVYLFIALHHSLHTEVLSTLKFSKCLVIENVFFFWMLTWRCPHLARDSLRNTPPVPKSISRAVCIWRDALWMTWASRELHIFPDPPPPTKSPETFALLPDTNGIATMSSPRSAPSLSATVKVPAMAVGGGALTTVATDAVPPPDSTVFTEAVLCRRVSMALLPSSWLLWRSWGNELHTKNTREKKKKIMCRVPSGIKSHLTLCGHN